MNSKTFSFYREETWGTSIRKIFGAFSILNLRISGLVFSLINYTSVLRLMSKKGLPPESSNAPINVNPVGGGEGGGEGGRAGKGWGFDKF